MRKTVIIVNWADLVNPGAAAIRYLGLARGIVENGVDVCWLQAFSTVPADIRSSAHYAKFSFLEMKRSLGFCHSQKMWRLLSRFLFLFMLNSRLKIISESSLETACLTYGKNFFFLSAIHLACKKYNIKLLHEVTEHPFIGDIGILSRLNIFLYVRLFVCKLDHLFVISRSLHEYFVCHTKRSNCCRISILNMIVESDLFENVVTSRYNPAREIVYVGTMYGNKDGVYDLVEAFNIIMNDYPDVKLIIVGDNTLSDEMGLINDAIFECPDPSRIVFTGRLDRNDVIKLISRAYCLALSRPNNVQAKYGFPTKLGEYLATERPVVVTSVGDIPIFLRDGETAFIASPDDAQSFAGKLRLCLDNPDYADEIGKNGKALVFSAFNYFLEAKKIVDAF